jgi:hypothetical protein
MASFAILGTALASLAVDVAAAAAGTPAVVVVVTGPVKAATSVVAAAVAGAVDSRLCQCIS